MTNVLLMERDAKPLELQRCHPKGMSRFVLQMSAGTLVRVFDFTISPEVSLALTAEKGICE